MKAATLLHWRTFIFAALALAFLLAGLYLCLRYPTAGVAIFTAFVGGVGFIVAAVAGKSSIEHLAGGGGIGGAWKVLMTSDKPEPPTQPGSTP